MQADLEKKVCSYFFHQKDSITHSYKTPSTLTDMVRNCGSNEYNT